MARIIETRKLSSTFIKHLRSLTPEELEEKYKNGDYLYISGIVFQMVYYSRRSLPSGQSVDVTYWAELYDLEINLDFAKETTGMTMPTVDWRENGF